MSIPPRNTTIPDGLAILLEALSRAAFRHHPENLIDFASLFFDELRQFRSNMDNLIKEFRRTKGGKCK
uniref:RIIa domain-containing protein n=1 Tax=Electrophorus electricus TaxID=8005 RepID=A0A4W4GXT1_ELEEL